MTAEEDRGGVFIPPDVLYDSSLNCSQKVLFSRILFFCENSSTGCYASDDYFAKLLGIGKRQVRRMLKQLEDRGLIDRDGSVRRRYLYTNRERLNPDYGCEKYGMSEMS